MVLRATAWERGRSCADKGITKAVRSGMEMNRTGRKCRGRGPSTVVVAVAQAPFYPCFSARKQFPIRRVWYTCKYLDHVIPYSITRQTVVTSNEYISITAQVPPPPTAGQLAPTPLRWVLPATSPPVLHQFLISLLHFCATTVETG